MDISLPAVKTPTDVLAVVPYLLGFTPERSIVVIAMRDRRVVFQARADVPATDAGLASGIVNASLQISAAIGM